MRRLWGIERCGIELPSCQSEAILKSEFYIPTVANNLIQEGKGCLSKSWQAVKVWFLEVTYTEDKPVVIAGAESLVMNRRAIRKDLWK